VVDPWRRCVGWLRDRAVLRRPTGRYAAVGVLVVGMAFAALPGSTSADPSCTDTWTGTAGDASWQTAENWSTDSVPGSGDVACIGLGTTVHVTGGANQAAVLKDEGTLEISGGSLELVSSTEVSSVESLMLSGGTLTGAGALDVSGTLSWTGGTMSGSGKTVLESGTTGTINPGSGSAVGLTERELTNAGTLTLSSGSVEGRSNAEIDNSGTLIVNSEAPGYEWWEHGLLNSDGSNVWLDNTGTVKKASGGEFSQIQFQVDNEGTVDVETGQIIFTGGNHGGTAQEGSWVSTASGAIVFDAGSYLWGSGIELEGTVYLGGGSVQSGDIQGPHAELVLFGGGSELDLTDGSMESHLGSLSVRNATTLTGVGAVDLSEAFSWTGGTMSGSGKTILESGATGTINPGSGSAVALTERELTNEGTLTLSSGSVEGRSNAEIDNSGTLIVNSQAPGYEWWEHGLLNSDGSGVWLENTGTVKKTSGGEFSQIQFKMDNEGTVDVETGQIIFSGGSHGSSAATGSWESKGGGQVSFNVGSYLLGSDIHMSGEVFLAGGNVQAGDIQAPDVTLQLWGGESTLTLTDSSTMSHVGSLEEHPNTTLTGAGTLGISNSLSWGGSSTMSGSGSTVLGSSATGSIEASSGCEPMSLTERRLVNEGSVTFGSGTLYMSAGARLENKGTFGDNSESSCEGPQIQDPSGSGVAPSILNTGSFEKSAGGGTSTVDVNFSNQGTVEAKTGTLDFGDGGIPEEVAMGSWAVQSGAHIVLSGGTFLIGEAVDLSAVEVTGATVERVPVTGPPAGHLNPLPYASHTVSVSGVGASVGTGFSSAGIEITPAGENEWHSLCGPLTPGLMGEFGCSWNAASGFYADGKYQLRAQLSDSSEPPNTAPTAAITVLVDNTPPTGSVSAAPYLGGTAAPVSGTAEDSGSGVASWQLQITPAGKAEWTNVCPAQTTPMSGSTYGCDVDAAGDGDGAYELQALVTDNAGNEYTTPVVETTFDSTPPTGTLDRVTEAEYVRGMLSLEGTASDSISGVASWTPQVLPAGSSSWTNVCSPQTMPISGSTYGCSLNTTTLADGEYAVRVQVANNAGSTYDTATQTITVDNTPPTGSLDGLPHYSSGTIEVRGKASDVLSGVTSWQLQIAPGGGGSWEDACLEQILPIEGSIYGCSVDTTPFSDGPYQLRALITDHAGNTYTTPAVVTRVDNTTPLEPSTCDDTWTGDGGDGLWQTTSNWSTESLPGAGDRACIGAGETVQLTSGSYQVGSVEDEGTLRIAGGSLELGNTSPASHVASFELWNGTLSGPGTLDVGSHFYWGYSGVMAGSGRTVLDPEVSGAAYFGERGGSSTLDERTFVNEGFLLWYPGQLDEENGAVFENKGTFDDPSEGTIFAATGGTAPLIENTGTFEKTTDSGASQVGVTFENDGTVDAQTGQLAFTGGSTPGEAGAGSWTGYGEASIAFQSGSFSLGSGVKLAGDVDVTGGSVSAGDLQASSGTLIVSAGSLELTDASTTSHLPDFELWNGSLSGAGSLVVSSSFYWGGGGVMSGSGRTVVGPGGSGAAYFGGYGGSLDERTFVNEGSFEWAPGTLAGADGGTIENKGTFDDSSEGTIFSGSEAAIDNTGTFEKTKESGTSQVGFQFENNGTVEAQTGQLVLTGGGVPGKAATGSWTANSGASIALHEGSFLLGSGVELTGDIDVNGASVTAGDLQGPATQLVVSAGSLELNSFSPASRLSNFELWNGSLSGPGTLEVTNHFYWGGAGVMSGSGRTVLGSGVSSAAYFGGYGGTLDERTLVNEGSFTWYPGTLSDENGAVFENKGTFDVVSEGTIFADAGGAAPAVENTGTFELTSTSATGRSVFDVGFDNRGTVDGETGQLVFAGGGVPGEAATGAWDGAIGTWDPTRLPSIVFEGGTYLIEKGVGLDVRDEGATIIWVAASVRGTLESQPYGSGTVTVAGTGERGVGGPFSSATIELTPQGADEWTTLCGPLTPGLAGEYSCSWDTATGGYPDGNYELRAKLAGGSLAVEETALTPTTTVLVDNTAPTGSVTEPAHDVDGHPLITGSASDGGSGIQSWQLQIAPESSSEWTSACPAQGAALSDDGYGCIVNTTSYTDGSYELRALIADRAGNTYTTPTVSMHIDNGSLGGTLGSVEPYVGKTVELAGTASSTGAAVASWAVQATPAGTSSWTSACPTQDTPVSGSEYRCDMDTTAFFDGEYELRAVVTDDEGNTYTTAPVTASIDNTPPVGSLDELPAKVTGDIEVQGQASDAGSGVASWTLQIAPVGSETFEQACLTQTLPTSGIVYGCTVDTGLLTAGSYQFRAVIVDNLDNTYTTPAVSTTVESATLSSTVAPTISGEAVAGSALTASSGSWSGTGTLSYAYQWQRCNASGEACTSIEGATARSYLPASGDVGSTLRVVVTASNGTEELSETSSPSSVVQANSLANSSVPVISGSDRVGATLSADPGRWQGSQPISYTYQWQECNASGEECTNISGATGQSYMLREEDVSHTLRVVVTATNEEGSANATSAASTSISAGSGSGIRYLYDEAGRLQIVDDPSQGAAVYEWDPDGNLTSIKRYSASTLAVLAVTPPHSPPGTQVDITGTGFSTNPSEDEVSFDGTSATVSEATATDLIVTVPEGAGTGAITVTVGGHSSESPSSFAPDALSHSRASTGIHLSSGVSAPALASTPNTPAAQAQGQEAPKPTVKKSTVKHSRSAKRTARRARRKPRTGHKRKRGKLARKTKHKKTKKSAPKKALKHPPAMQAAAVPARAPSQNTSVPPAISSYRSPDPATWAPTARNRRGGDWLTGRGLSPWASLPALRSAHVNTGLSGQALVINGTPLVNVTLTIQGTSKQTKTDSSGRFLLEGLSAGHQILDIDGGSADGHGQRYGQFSVGVELVKGKVTALGYTIWMTPLDPAGNKRIPSPTRRETIVTNPKIPGLEVRLPAGTVVRDAAGKVLRSLNMTAIPVDRPPFPLPFVSGIPTYFTVQPGRAYLNKGAQIIYPNWGHLPPGQRVDFWNYDPTDKGWYIYGKGSVSTNGKQLIPDPNVRVWEFTGAMVSDEGGPPGTGPASGGSTEGGDPVDLATGLFVYQHTDLELPDSVMPVALTRTYRPGDDASYSFGIGTTSPFELRLWSDENYQTAYLVEPDGGKVKLQRTSPGTGWEEAVYTVVKTPGPWEGAVMRYNSTDPEGGWTLRRRDGMKFIFGDVAPLEAIEDPNGNRITLVRQNGPTGPIVQIRAPHGRLIDLSYDSYNRIVQASDNAGQTIKYRYDSTGRLALVTDPDGRATRYAYNSENDMTTVTDARGKVLISNTYEGEKVKTQTLGGLGTYHFSYSYPESPSEVAHTRLVDPDGHEHVLYWNTSTGLPLSERIGSQQISYQRDAEGNITHVTASSGDTSYSYNALGDITSIRRETSGLAPLTTSFTYNEASERTSTTNPLGQTTSYTYDTDGNLIRVTDPMGRQTTFGYDSEGELTSTTDPQGNTTSYAYENGEQTAVINPLDQKTEVIYDDVGRPVGIRDPEGRLTQFAYDSDNDLISETDPAGDKTSYGYDADGDLTSVTDPEGHTQTGTYNAFGQLSSWTDALGQTTSYTHDVMGDITSVTDPKGQTTNYTYNALNKLSSASFGATDGGSPTSTISYGYDGAGDLTSVADSRAGTWTLSYDPYHRLTEETGPTGSVGYTYNAASELQSMSLEGEEAAAYAYDPDGQLTGISTPNGDVSLAYDHDGSKTQAVLPDGDSENYSYNAASQLAGVTYQRPGGEDLGDLQYTRDALGRVSTVSGSYARMSLPEAFSEASYNADNELTSLKGHTYSYDADGNLTSNGTSSFEWNDRNQLAGVTQGSNTWSYAYDPVGRRINKTANGDETKYLFEDENVAREASEGKTAQLINGLGLDERFARTTSAGTDSYLTDALGSTLALAGEGGEPATEYTYSPFGAATATGAASTNPYQYTGRETEGNGLQDNRARYYEPGTGRFISQDPLGMAGSGINLYRYVGDSPMNATDPYGLIGLGTGPGGADSGADVPGPGSCGSSGGTKSSGGRGFWGKVQCNNYERLDETEREIGREREETSADEYEEGVKKRDGKIIEGCGVGATGTATAGAILGSPGGPAAAAAAAGAAAVPGCAAGAGTEAVKILEERALEL
jgi:RHS repeat-associated protein